MPHIMLCSIQLALRATCFCEVLHLIGTPLEERCKVCVALSGHTNKHSVLSLPTVSQGGLVPLKNSYKSQIAFVTSREVFAGVYS